MATAVTHDPLCPQPAYDNECKVCDLIARVRADEREDADRRVDRIILRGANMHHATLTDLRAKVEALTTLPLGGWDVVFLKDVLALIDEAAK